MRDKANIIMRHSEWYLSFPSDTWMENWGEILAAGLSDDWFLKLGSTVTHLPLLSSLSPFSDEFINCNPSPDRCCIQKFGAQEAIQAVPPPGCPGQPGLLIHYKMPLKPWFIYFWEAEPPLVGRKLHPPAWHGAVLPQRHPHSSISNQASSSSFPPRKNPQLPEIPSSPASHPLKFLCPLLKYGSVSVVNAGKFFQQGNVLFKCKEMGIIFFCISPNPQ